MKKIIITESQLKKITENLINEQSSAVMLGGLKTILNTSNPKDEYNFGTLTIYNNKNKPVQIRFTITTIINDVKNVNIVKLNPQADGGADIETKLGIKKSLDKKIVDRLVNFINNDDEKKLKSLTSELGNKLNVIKLN